RSVARRRPLGPGPAATPAAVHLWRIRWCFHAVHACHLHAALARPTLAINDGALLQIRRGKTRKRRRMTERVGTIFQSDKSKTLGGIEPLHGCALRSGTGPRAIVIELCHCRCA